MAATPTVFRDAVRRRVMARAEQLLECCRELATGLHTLEHDEEAEYIEELQDAQLAPWIRMLYARLTREAAGREGE